MVRRLAITAVALSLPMQLSAQRGIASTVGLTTTPLGALTPLVPSTNFSPAKTTFGFQQRLSYVGATRTLGMGMVVQRGAMRTTFEYGSRAANGWLKRGAPMGGVDVQLPLMERVAGKSMIFAVGINPAVGFGRSDEKHEFASTAIGVSVPLTLLMDVGDSTLVVPFVSPGIGVSQVRENAGGVHSVTNGMVTFGVTMGGTDTPINLTMSMRKFFVMGSPSVYGFGLSFRRR